MACAKAITVGDPSYRTIKSILAAGLEADPPPPSSGDGGAAAFLHGPSRLFMNVVALPTPTTGTDTTSTLDATTASADHGVDRAGAADGEPGAGVSA